jgi:hypothetical protein
MIDALGWPEIPASRSGGAFDVPALSRFAPSGPSIFQRIFKDLT